MSDLDALDERLRAVERALTDGDDDLTGLRDAAELTRELESLADRIDAAEDRLDELDAATQALRGYVGNVRAVNRSVERRADAALAKAEALEGDGRTAAEPPTDDARQPTRGTEQPTDEGTTPDGPAPLEPDRPCRCASRRGGRSTNDLSGEGIVHSESANSEGEASLLARVGRALGAVL